MNREDKGHIHILVVDDEQGMRDLLSLELGNQGYQVSTATNGEEALACVWRQKVHLVITDVKMPNMTGITLLDEIKKTDPEIEVILSTGYGTIETAVDAMKKGAYDFVQKPFNLSEMLAVVEKALEKSEMKTLIALYESSKAIFSTIKLDELLEIVMTIIQKVFNADQGSIMLLNEEKRLYIATSRGIPSDLARSVNIKIGERVAGRVAESKQGIVLVDTLDHYPEFKGMSGKPNIKSSIVHPIIFRNELLGVLNLNRTQSKKAFTHSDLRSVAIFTSQIAQAIQNARLYHTIESRMKELKKAYQVLEETQDQLVRSEKLASLGRFVAGVAHEINNPLTAVMGYSQMLLRSKKIRLEESVRTKLEIVAREAERCSEIVMDLLTFSRPRKPRLEKTDLCALVDEAVDVLKLHMEKAKVKIENHYPRKKLEIEVDPQQIRQVILNIISNACHAMEATARHRKLEITVRSDDYAAHIEICDNGPGISKENLPRIFDPFFTTKETGKGTGLGLSLCYSIVREHGGFIGVKSREGKGTEFEIRLPMVQKRRSEDRGIAPQQETAKITDGRHRKVLVVENEPSVRNWVQELLQANGFEIDSAEDGDKGMEKIRKRQFDLVICDFHLPGLMGDVIYKKTKKEKPELAKRFVFITASAFGPEVEQFFDSNRIPWLHKPFTGEALLSVMAKRLREE